MKNIGKLTLAGIFVSGTVFFTGFFTDAEARDKKHDRHERPQWRQPHDGGNQLSPQHINLLRDWLNNRSHENRLNSRQRDALRAAVRDALTRNDARQGYYRARNMPPVHYNTAVFSQLPPGIQRQVLNGGRIPPGLQKQIQRGQLPGGLISGAGHPYYYGNAVRSDVIQNLPPDLQNRILGALGLPGTYAPVGGMLPNVGVLGNTPVLYDPTSNLVLQVLSSLAL